MKFADYHLLGFQFSEEETNYAYIGSGGGFKGSFTQGIRDVYLENGIVPAAEFGISVNALDGAMQAMNKRAVNRQLWKAIEESGPASITVPLLLKADMKSPDMGAIREALLPESLTTILFRLATPKGKKRLGEDIKKRFAKIKSVASNKPLLDLLAQHVRIKDFVRPFYCGAVSLTDGKYYLLGPEDFDDDYELAKFICASATMPIVWEPIASVRLKDGRILTNLVDGGLWDNSPLSAYIDFVNSRPKSEKWHAIIANCGCGFTGTVGTDLNIAQIATRSLLDVALAAIFEGDVARFLQVNHLVKQSPVELLSENGKPYRHFDYTLIQPMADELGDTLDTSPEILQKRYAYGREYALDAIIK
ncbi:patatin-like phospholipase family protein [Larkinella insperata]|uniref:Patatin-like phospholipase family protein n=1 Tax=Larkinella insperata TaxID=332158 RepID=A0ABW3QKE0_9BACT|nr:patatin-like phospholipase family protein [Larkinella insperata]